MPLDWKPRGRELVIGGVPWLARATDKARASMSGAIGDYVYPCPADEAFFNSHKIDAATFTRIVKENLTDDLMIERMREIDDKSAKS